MGKKGREWLEGQDQPRAADTGTEAEVVVEAPPRAR